MKWVWSLVTSAGVFFFAEELDANIATTKRQAPLQHHSACKKNCTQGIELHSQGRVKKAKTKKRKRGTRTNKRPVEEFVLSESNNEDTDTHTHTHTKVLFGFDFLISFAFEHITCTRVAPTHWDLEAVQGTQLSQMPSERIEDNGHRGATKRSRKC